MIYTHVPVMDEQKVSINNKEFLIIENCECEQIIIRILGQIIQYKFQKKDNTYYQSELAEITDLAEKKFLEEFILNLYGGRPLLYGPANT